MEETQQLLEEDLSTLFGNYNLMVSEIQRDYVWGDLDRNREVIAHFFQSLRDDKENMNVGFLYSYQPPYAPQNGKLQETLLIDGQQRITTLFLLLLSRAVRENRMKDFLALCRYDKERKRCLGFNYKVRQLTQQFLIDLLEYLFTDNSKDKLDSLMNSKGNESYPTWLLNDYQHDVTVRSMLGALTLAHEMFGADEEWYDRIGKVRFWHFHTEATSQGEELYITMNSRGVNLQPYEIRKADFLPDDDWLNYGKKWEDYQDFFWKHRDKNENADTGFNNFLNCLTAMKRFQAELKQQDGKDVELTNEDVEEGMEALEYLFQWRQNEGKGYQPPCNIYNKWFANYQKEILELLNGETVNWEIHPEGVAYNNATQPRINSQLLWPWLYRFKQLKCSEQQEEITDLLHQSYMRFICKRRNTKSIFNQNEEEDKVESRGDEEERLIQQIHQGRAKIKSILWEFQDLPIFRQGRQLTSTTCLDILRIVQDNTLSEEGWVKILTKALDAVRTISSDSVIANLIRSIMLIEKEEEDSALWKRQSPWYYRNYSCIEWKYVFSKDCFRDIFTKVFIQPESQDKEVVCKVLRQMLEAKRKAFFEEEIKEINRQSLFSDRQLVVIYNAVLKDDFWIDDLQSISLSQPKPEEDTIGTQQTNVYTCKTRYIGKEVPLQLPDKWKEDLMERYPKLKIG
jgi:hypothetical protein